MRRDTGTMAAVAAGALLLLGACGVNTEQKAASGALGGAAAGALIGGPVGAVVGAGVGAAGGTAVEKVDSSRTKGGTTKASASTAAPQPVLPPDSAATGSSPPGPATAGSAPTGAPASGSTATDTPATTTTPATTPTTTTRYP